MKLSMKTLSAACLLALAPAAAMANLTPVYQNNVAGAGFFTWTYNVQLASDQNVNVGTAPTVNPVGSGNTGTGGFFTIYDFYGYIAGSCSGPAGWACTSQNVGYTPFDVSPVDRPDIVNLTWVHTTGADIVGQSGSNAGTNLGDFTAQTLFSLTTQVGYASRGIKNNGQQAGTTADNVGSTTGPRDVTLVNDVPEPGSLALMALGLGFVGMTRRKSKKAA
jgi:hypothetical protein